MSDAEQENLMVLIAIDPHKSTHTAVAVNEQGVLLEQRRVGAREQRELLRWAHRWPQRRWAIEGAHGLGHQLAQWLVAEGEAVVDVPASLVRRVRLLAVGDKTDLLDARATAEAALRAEALHPVLAEDERMVLRLLSDRRDDLTEERTRTVNRLHRLLRELVPGGAPVKLTADVASRLLRGRRPRGVADGMRRELAQQLVEDVRRLDRELKKNEQRLAKVLSEQGSELTRHVGIGVILAAKLVGRSGPIERFPSVDHYVAYTGTAPLAASSGETTRHRLSRRGDRQLNRALHMAALTQARMPSSAGYAYMQRRRAEGKSYREALRCLKRHLARVVYRQLVADQRLAAAA
jgi:transposase